MRHGVFSVTKSLGAAVALLSLAQKYGDEVFDLKIKDYVPVTAGHDGWERVTFGDALNMATSIGDLAPQRRPNDPLADENQPKMFKWLRARTAKEKLDVSFSYGKYSWGTWRSASLQQYPDLCSRRGDGQFSQTPGRPQGSSVGYGCERSLPSNRDFPCADDAYRGGGRRARHSFTGVRSLPDHRRYRQIDHTVAERRPLSGPPTAQCCEVGRSVVQDQRQWVCRPERRTGLAMRDTICRSGPPRITPTTAVFFRFPHMAGFGGNLVVLLPNGISAFRFADGFDFDVEAMVLAGESLRPFCSTAAEQTPPSVKRQPLTASELNTVFSDHTFYGDSWRMFAAADGVIYRSSRNASDVGKWRIAPDGQFCRAWWDRPQERCYVVYQDGEMLELYPSDRWGQELVIRAPGNPEGY